MNDKQKLKVIKTLIENGSRGSEWQEAGLLRQIEIVINSKKDKFSSKEIMEMIKTAREF